MREGPVSNRTRTQTRDDRNFMEKYLGINYWEVELKQQQQKLQFLTCMLKEKPVSANHILTKILIESCPLPRDLLSLVINYCPLWITRRQKDVPSKYPKEDDQKDGLEEDLKRFPPE